MTKGEDQGGHQPSHDRLKIGHLEHRKDSLSKEIEL